MNDLIRLNLRKEKSSVDSMWCVLFTPVSEEREKDEDNNSDPDPHSLT